MANVICDAAILIVPKAQAAWTTVTTIITVAAKKVSTEMWAPGDYVMTIASATAASVSTAFALDLANTAAQAGIPVTWRLLQKGFAGPKVAPIKKAFVMRGGLANILPPIDTLASRVCPVDAHVMALQGMPTLEIPCSLWFVLGRSPYCDAGDLDTDDRLRRVDFSPNFSRTQYTREHRQFAFGRQVSMSARPRKGQDMWSTVARA